MLHQNFFGVVDSGEPAQVDLIAWHVGFMMIDCGRRIETSCKGQRKDGDKLAFWEEDLVDNRCSPQVVCRLYMHALLRLGGSLMHLKILVILRS